MNSTLKLRRMRASVGKKRKMIVVPLAELDATLNQMDLLTMKISELGARLDALQAENTCLSLMGQEAYIRLQNSRSVR